MAEIQPFKQEQLLFEYFCIFMFQCLIMKRVCCFMSVLLLICACSHKQEYKPVAKQNLSPLVIHFPSGIIIPHRDSLNTANNFSLAQKFLSSHTIPVLVANTENLIFVKRNGDRVSILIKKSENIYDIILFDGLNDPVPLKIIDLENAGKHLFSIPTTIKTIKQNRKITLKKHSVPTPDSVIQTAISGLISELISRNNRIIISVADTSTKKLNARTMQGIEWVEHRIDTRKLLRINFENDLITYSNTDRYFTNGITFDLQAAWLGHSRLTKVMIPYHHKAFVSYHLNMVQDMYTPTDTRIAPTLKNDRPYASYLYFGFREVVADPLRKLKIFSEFDAGYLGPYSPGSYMQTLVHKVFPTNDKPLGWDTQIKTDIILNYQYQVQKAIVNRKDFILLAGLEAKAGTLYNQFGIGFQFQAGKADPSFGSEANEKWPATEYYFFAKTNYTFVVYNALLQGGMLNQDNIFTLKANEIKRTIGKAEAGVHFRYKRVGFELAQHYLSPEYKEGLWHKWGRMSVLLML